MARGPRDSIAVNIEGGWGEMYGRERSLDTLHALSDTQFRIQRASRSTDAIFVRDVGAASSKGVRVCIQYRLDVDHPSAHGTTKRMKCT